MHLPYVLFVFLYVGNYLLIYEFESWITDVCSSYVVSLCDFAYYVFGKIAMHLSLCMFCLSAISMMFVKILLAVCILVGNSGMSESRVCVFRELCPVSNLIVGKCPSVLL